jgi:hypothetical protein
MENISDKKLKQKLSSQKYYLKIKTLRAQTYQENKEVLKQNSLERYTEKYNNDEEFRTKRKNYMREYAKQKREERKLQLSTED